jgi:hypothetical protein
MRKLPDPLVHTIMVLAFLMMFFNVVFVEDENIYRGVTFLFLFIFGFLIFNQLYGKIDEGRIGPRKKVLLYSELLGKSVLIKYTPLSHYEQIISEIVEHFVEKIPILIISTLPKSNLYFEAFEREIKKGKVKLVEITITGTRSANTTPMKLPISELDWLREVYAEIPKGGIIIFEPLSDTIINLGYLPSYKLVRHWIEMCSEKNLSFIALLNYTSHHKETISAFEGLFLTVALVEDKKLLKVR